MRGVNVETHVIHGCPGQVSVVEIQRNEARRCECRATEVQVAHVTRHKHVGRRRVTQRRVPKVDIKESFPGQHHAVQIAIRQIRKLIEDQFRAVSHACWSFISVDVARVTQRVVELKTGLTFGPPADDATPRGRDDARDITSAEMDRNFSGVARRARIRSLFQFRYRPHILFETPSVGRRVGRVVRNRRGDRAGEKYDDEQEWPIPRRTHVRDASDFIWTTIRNKNCMITSSVQVCGCVILFDSYGIQESLPL